MRITTRTLVDQLARDVADWMMASEMADLGSAEKRLKIVAAIRARHAAPAEAGKRWWVVDNKGIASLAANEPEARDWVVQWDRHDPRRAPHRAILATDADDARLQYATLVHKELWYVVDKLGAAIEENNEAEARNCVAGRDHFYPWRAPHRAIFATSAEDARAQYAAMEAGDSRSAGQEPHLTPVAGHDPANPTPPADDDDAGARLVQEVGKLNYMFEEPTFLSLLDLAREVVCQRDEARLRVARLEGYADTVEKERDEARREAEKLYRETLARAVTAERERDEARRDRDAWERDCIEAHVKLAAAEARERELRALCDQLRGGVND